jgi:hypothetical protein
VELVLEIIFVFPLLTMIAIAATDKFPRTRSIWAFSLSALSAACLGYGIDLASAASDQLLDWNEGGYAIIYWLMVGTFTQSLGYYVSRRKWPLAAPYTVAATIYFLLSFPDRPYHRVTTWVLLGCGALVAWIRRPEYG